MPLEFALRPRFDLERKAPQRKLRKARVSPLALPMLAYWVAIAGGTHFLLRSIADESRESDANAASLREVAEVDAVSPNLPRQTPPAASPQVAVTAHDTEVSAPPEPAFEPAPRIVAATDHEPHPERSPDASGNGPESGALHVSKRPVAFAPAPARDSDVDAPPASRETERRASRETERPDKRETERPGNRETERPGNRDTEQPGNREAARDEGRASSLPSCESAAASASETMDLRAAPGVPDLPREAFSSVLENGAYLARCAIPPRTALEICAAVQDGKVVGVSITSEPLNPSINTCVRRAVATLRFPRSARLDVTRTHFAAAR
jgi:hypothetical protein